MTQEETEHRRLAYSDRDLDAGGVLSRKQRWRLRKAGKFPRARQIGARNLYIADEVHEWLRDPEGWAERNEAAKRRATG